MAEHGDLTRAEYYDRVRSQIEHEDELINLRVVWQLLVQSFFFSTFATLLNAKDPAKNALIDQLQHFLVWVVPIAAFLAGLLTFVGIVTALLNVNSLRRSYEDYSRDTDGRDQSSKLFPPIQGPDHLRKLAQISPIGLPLLFILTWLIILIRLVAGAWD
ncbi:MAG TPA: hypothetical protein VJ692_14930 [Nitrospiraceae bacterium]|nr:hypothetical protein [Nitrospiraceae bacterium]